MTNHLFDAISESIQEPEHPAFELPGGRSISYAGMIETTGRIANALQAFGVLPGARVAAQVEKSVEALLLYLACVRAGAVYLPLNSAYTLPEVEYFIGDARPTLFVCDPRRLEQFSGLAADTELVIATLDRDGGGSLMDKANAASPDFRTIHRKPEDLAAILYTSGTTGRSKGAMLTHDNLLSNALMLREYWQFTRSDRLIHALPVFHTHGLFVATNTALLAGSTMIMLPGFDADQVLGVMPGATVMMGVPTFYVRLLQHPGLDRDVSANMRLFISGSAPLLVETHQSFEQRTGHVILERYGMTETNMNTSNPYQGERIAGTVGLPLPGVSLRTVDPDDGHALPRGEIGMIEVKGPNVFAGYWNMPERTAQEFRDGYFITGDLGMIDDRGYVTIIGRDKDLIISGGYNVYPKEIEEEIDAIAGVEESAVVGIAHPDFGEGVTAFVVARANATIGEALVVDALKSRLANYKRPKQIVFIPKLPRNTMGKVQKNVLREQYAKIYSVD